MKKLFLSYATHLGRPLSIHLDEKCFDYVIVVLEIFVKTHDIEKNATVIISIWPPSEVVSKLLLTPCCSVHDVCSI
jgi:hypothetical protein